LATTFPSRNGGFEEALSATQTVIQPWKRFARCEFSKSTTVHVRKIAGKNLKICAREPRRRCASRPPPESGR
jgi:hypothetical protein